ncbi:MAG: thioredoxin [Candidatus Falkowbacteria bacterium]
MTQHFTDADFATAVIEASKTKPVLVDFFAVWCGPCQMQAPIIENVAQTIGDKAVVGKVNVDEAPQAAGQFGVMSIPTIIIFKDGKAAQTFVGVQMHDDLVAALQKLA